MKLPFFSSDTAAGGQAAERVAPPWQTLVVVCASCKGARKGPDGRGIRKRIKHTIGKDKRLRIAEVDCLGVCPDDAVTVCTVRHPTGHAEVTLVRSDHEVDALARSVDPRS